MGSPTAGHAGCAAPALLALLLVAACSAAGASSAGSVATTAPAVNGTGYCMVAPPFDVQETSTQMFLDIAGAHGRPSGFVLGRSHALKSARLDRAAVVRAAFHGPRCTWDYHPACCQAAARACSVCCCPGHVALLTRPLPLLLFAVIMLVCRFVGIVFKSIGQPTVIGEIIAGATLCIVVARWAAALALVLRCCDSVRACIPLMQ